MTNGNLSRCSKCGRSLIVEEKRLHECKKVVDYRIEKNILWLSDGQKWFPQRLLSQQSSPRNQHPFTTPEDSTEPNIILFTL